MDTSTLMRMRACAIIFESHSCFIICVISSRVTEIVETLLWTSHYIFFFFFLLVSEWVWMINKQRRLVDKYTRFGSKNVIFISLHSLTFFSPFTPLASHHIYHRNSRELICVLSRVYLLNKAVPANSSHPIFVTTGEVFLYFFIVR